MVLYIHVLFYVLYTCIVLVSDKLTFLDMPCFLLYIYKSKVGESYIFAILSLVLSNANTNHLFNNKVCWNVLTIRYLSV